jgi:hypothetical protein
MKSIKWLILMIAAAIFFCTIPSICFAQDPGLPDSVIIDTVSVPLDSVNYTTRYIPVYFVTNDTVCFVYISLKINSPDSMIFFGRTVWRTPFSHWDDVYDTLLYSHHTGIRMVLFCDIGGPTNPPFYPDSLRVLGLNLRIMIAPSAQPQFAWIDTIESIAFGDSVPQFQRGYVRYGGVSEIGNEMTTPTSFELLQNYPNPFNSQTVIEFYLRESAPVKLEIFDITGAKIITLVDRKMAAGKHSVIWDAAKYPSGIYFYRLIAGDYSRTEKMLLIK